MYEVGANAAGAPVNPVDVAGFVNRLPDLATDVDDAALVDNIRQLEQLKAAAAAAQARMTAAFAASQRAAQLAAGVPAARVGQGVSAQVALARRDSPARAARYTGWARVLVAELPNTFAALQRGDISEWRALIVARETIWLAREHRTLVDAALAGRLSDLGDRQVEAETRRLGYRLDPHGFLARARAAEQDRRVSLRPAPDTMARLTALLPAAQGVAAYAALKQAADTARAEGDARGRGQVMADTLVERVTGQTSADAVPVEINLVLTDHTMFGDTATPAGNPGGNRSAAAQDRTAAGGVRTLVPPAAGTDGADEPGLLLGYGPIPAGLARDLARSAQAAASWIRRLYRHPTSGQLVGLDTRRRAFDGELRHAIIVRDQLCRTPWCNAPIRHADHATPVAQGGATSLTNGQGLCEACNYAKQAPGWSTGLGPRGTSEQVSITTPTGHTYHSRPPDLPDTAQRRTGSDQRAGPAPPVDHTRAA